ncbi:monooxygenase [Coniochaeta ligniaria NRRL 30616]|uniref:Monooxygenase n=1 Tax=Coniochaeta ligniaria NRRL 30616 TaxID=1408157 RepID=A0A1J7JJK7_9PEZI|nr:monooxygenase [Coniochaeta ligniaria NRRL 30616]
MSTFRVLIIGGGIAGPSLAFWLNRLSGFQGVEYAVTIVERSPNLRAQGQQIDLRGQGLTAMRLMGLEKQIREKVVPEEGVQLLDKTGRQMAVLKANKTGKGMQSVTSEFEIMRGDLVRILYDITKDKNKYIFGATVTKLEDIDGDQVRVTFSDGSGENYDLVVGADGQNSRTRRMMPGADATDPFTSLGLYMAYFTVPRIESDSEYACVHHAVDNRVIFTRADNPKTIQCALAILASSPLAHKIRAVMKASITDQKKAWAEVFSDAGWQGPRFVNYLLNGSLSDESFYTYELGRVKTQTWCKGRVVLLGDAAFCPSPLTGFGTSLAMVGAYVLAGELGQHMHDGRVVDVPAALEAYDRTLRPLVDQVQKLPPGVPSIFYPKTEWGIWFFQMIFWTVTVLRIDKLVQMFGSDDRGTWQVPDYKVLKNMTPGTVL